MPGKTRSILVYILKNRFDAQIVRYFSQCIDLPTRYPTLLDIHSVLVGYQTWLGNKKY